MTVSRRGSSRVAGRRNYPQRPLKAVNCRLILYEAKKLKQKSTRRHILKGLTMCGECKSDPFSLTVFIIRILYNKIGQKASTFLLPRQRISAQDIVRFCGCYSQDVVILYNIVYVLLCAFLFFGENAGYVGSEFKSVYEIRLGAHAAELLRRVEAEFPRRDGGNVILKMPRLFFTAVK